MPIHLPSLVGKSPTQNTHSALFSIMAGLLLVLMAFLAGGAALRESATIDEVAHIGAGVSYLQKLDLRLNGEHPPLPKVLAALPLVLRGTHADYSNISWTVSQRFASANTAQWVFGEWLLTRWNNPVPTLAWARLPMLFLTLAMGWIVWDYARRLGGAWGGLLCLSLYVSTPAFLAFGPLVLTDLAVTLFSLLTLWRLAELWLNPGQKNVTLFALGLAGALLSKFTAGILFFAFAGFAWSTRWRAVPGQPSAEPEARVWRRLRLRVTYQGIVWAALTVYAFYFIFSWNQSTEVVPHDFGTGPAAAPLRRLFMSPWLYLRGLLWVTGTSSRPTFILGHAYPHGVWFYFPVLLILKSTLGFLGLLAMAGLLAMRWKQRGQAAISAIPPGVQLHWRVLCVSLLPFVGFCLLSPLNISIRHFSLPLVLLIILLAPLPRMLERLWASARLAGRLMTALAVVLAMSCLFTALRAYPYYFPYVNALSLGNPAYALVNDSNVDWNQSLPEVKRFAELHGLQRVELDAYGLSDTTVAVPQSQYWNCQEATGADDGQWAVVSASMILDGHNCSWLMQYPHEPLAGGSMYAVHLPAHIPAAGTIGGPPLHSAFHQFWGLSGDARLYFLDLIRHPEKLSQATAGEQGAFSGSYESQAQSPGPSRKR